MSVSQLLYYPVMRWVTRRSIHVNRTATAWLLRRFLDPAAELLFVDPAEVVEVQRREGAVGYDAPGATYPYADAQGRCSFEQLVAERLPGDPTLAALARIVHGADFPAEMDVTRESAGLWAISQGFTEVGRDDLEIVERASFLYDSLYAHLRRAAVEARRETDGRKTPD